jgi:hypothetical protein
MKWYSPSSPRQISSKRQKTKWCWSHSSTVRVIHKEFVPPGQTVNKEYHVEVLSCFIQRIHRVRPQFQERGSWFL